MSRSTDRDLLFGLLALQNNFIDRDTLVDAFHRWSGDRSVPMDRLMVDRGALSPGRHALLVGLVEEHIGIHGGDPERSLAALVAIGGVRDELARAAPADPDLQASLSVVARSHRDDDPFRTRAPESLGSETAIVSVPDRVDDPYQTRSPENLGASTSQGTRFRILRPHAKGGLGQVSVALDRELDRPVALKEIQDRHADEPESRVRFVQEAQITGKLEHPGIVPVYGLGQDATGRPYYAMRFIQGDSLERAIKALHGDEELRKDPAARMARLRDLLRRFTDVCNAMEYAHSRGVLHRDLKPANIMLGPYGETLVVDWGLAKAVSVSDEAGTLSGDGHVSGDGPIRLSGSSGSRTETEDGSIVGTPAFASPEQLSGRLNRLGPASDIYGLGATLYALLTGRPPIDTGTLEKLLDRVARGEIPPPRSVESTIPRPLEAICRKAMAVRPSGRYSGARELGRDLTRWLDDEPVSAYREPFAMRAGRWMRRHRTAVAVATSTLVLIAVVAIAARAAADARVRRLEAEAGPAIDRGTEALLRDDPGTAQRLLAEAVGRVAAEPRLAAFRDRADRLLDEANRQLEGRLARDRDRARYEAFRSRYDDALWNGTLFTGRDSGADRAKVAAREALATFPNPPGLDAVQVAPREKARIAACCHELRRLLALLGSEGPAVAEADPKAPAGDDDLSGSVDRFLAGLSAYYVQDVPRAAREFESALRAYPDHYWAQYFLALCHLKARRWGEARIGFNGCLARKPDSPWPLMLRGYAAGELRDFDAAEADFARALVLAPDDYGILVNRGALRIRRGQYDEATVDLKRAIAREPGQYQAYANLARALADRRRWAEALEPLDRAIQLAPRVAALQRSRARIHLEAGDTAEAMRDYERAIAIEPEGSPFRLLCRAEEQLARGRPREAIDAFDRYERVGTPDASFYQGRGLARAKMGDHPGAVEDYSRSLELEPNSNVRTRRGWVYSLRADAMALRDFDRALALNAGNLDAHAGRGYSLARLGRHREAVREAVLAIAPGVRDWEMKSNAACIYAQATIGARRDPSIADSAALADRYRDRSLELIRAALELVPDPGRRAAVWRQIAADPALDPIRDSAGFARLEAEYGDRR